MPPTIRKGFRQLPAEAEALIRTVPVAKALPLAEDPAVMFVDLRDIRELQREGRIPGAFHCPRGMLEFYIDPDSP
jgi:rhodanese-related sulfurtransferase